jgi:hypothetical protein
MNTKQVVPFNINSSVRILLTDYGREVYMEAFERVGLEVGPPKEDADGWVTMQLWTVMELFGPHIHMGCKQPFSTQIEILVD